MPKKTGRRPIDYKSVLNYYDKRGYHLDYGLDYLAFDLNLSQPQVISLQDKYKKFTPNTAQEYHEFSHLPGLLFSFDYSFLRHWFAINISIQSEEFPAFKAIQIYLNQDYSKVSFYWLFFRFTQLASIDWRVIAQDILGFYNLNQDLDTYRIMRLDYKVDIFNILPQEFYTRLRKYNHRKGRNVTHDSITYRKKWVLETKYIGSKQSKYAFARIYNKTIDTKRKKKDVFYFDHPQDTTRVEWQFGSTFTGSYKLSEIMRKVASYCGLDSLYEWKFYEGHRYHPDVIINVEKYKEDFEKRWKKLLDNGIDIGRNIESLIAYRELRTVRLDLSWYPNEEIVLSFNPYDDIG